ncbi:hypothetical protein ASPZODRAFT_133766 [Penicilliopsis zonata CBS 506.65]|uniref:Zn(2)-C6 fungal-type domain-containing protein n=1 Tax=Penicilliopsis zonata CBS 506.65 TaxID=1073090 RepID=A0A1L9SFE6_9EURO|nr:hypothetical protein ASPZODRAFT_133766 [Penicilliopsis zonata CBS 506.65]OJJ45899.1 hypothetical protein ASPZODRAFT_133766 [Penicilliopsis zonata CBS 506.65]
MASFAHLFDGDGRWGSPAALGPAQSPTADGKAAVLHHPTGKTNRSDAPDDEPQPKRAKMALSCSECKRRKIKCDRNVPCTACLKRGAGDACNWDNARIEPAPQPFALSSEMRDVQARLRAVEDAVLALRQGSSGGSSVDFIDSEVAAKRTPTAVAGASLNAPGSGAPDANGSATRAPVAASTATSTAAAAATGTAAPATAAAPVGSTTSDEGLSLALHDPAEDAAVTLESIAFNPPGSGPRRSVIAHEYWRGSVLTPSSEGTMMGADHGGDRVVDLELTAARTSIISPPWDASLARYNPILMGVGSIDGGTFEELQMHRATLLQGLLGALPTVRQSYYLAAQYYDTVHWRSNVLHWPSFQAELDRFWDMVQQGRHGEIDPLWLAVFYMVMALALDNRPAAIDPSHPFHAESLQGLDELTSKYHAVSVRALYLGDAMTSPRLRTIQTVILFNQFFQTSGRKADMLLTWTALAIRTAQVMGLHVLGSDPERMPPDDPAWPPGKNAVKRHLALRTWTALQWVDWMGASARFRSYMIHPEQCTSQPVANVNDGDLSSTDWRFTTQPARVATSNSFEVYKWHIADMLRQTYDRLITHVDRFSYAGVLHLDAGYRKIEEDLPDAYRYEQEGEDLKVRWQRNVALEGIHSRIVRLHRPFLSRGYARESKCVYSREQCLRSARIVVDCHYNLRDLTTRGTFWFVYSHTLGAALVLFLDLFWSIDNHMPPAEINERMSVIAMVHDIFSMYSEISNSSLRNIVESAFRIISDLSSEARNRQTVEGVKPPFAEILKRVARKVSLDSASQTQPAVTLPPQPLSLDAWNLPMPQEALNSGFYSALGVQNHETMDDPSFANLWTLNYSPSQDSPNDSLSFLNVAQPRDNYELWRFLAG